MPSELNLQSISQSREAQLPEFNMNTLESLNKRITSNLQKRENGKAAKIPQLKPKLKKDKKGGKERKNEVHAPKYVDAGKSNGKLQATQQLQQAPILKSIQGKKRSRDGRVKDSYSMEPGNGVNKIKLGKRTEKTTRHMEIELDDDMEALGGTKNDIKLIADAPSDSEMEGDTAGSKGASQDDLKKELRRFARQLGVDRSAQKDLLEPTVPEKNNLQELKLLKAKSGKILKPQDAEIMDSDSMATKPTRRGQLTLAFSPQSDWYAAMLPKLPALDHEITTLPRDLADRLHRHANSLLENDNKQYAAHYSSASSAHQFYSTIMSTGTLSDKISALTLSVQESPIHNMKALESLVGLARKHSRAQAVEVLGALKDLFGPGNLLPSDRKLKAFASQPALIAIFGPTEYQWTPNDPLPNQLSIVHLISWAYEDWLKKIFFDVLKILETWSNDEVVFARAKAVDYICQLLKEKPEQEANLLRLLVNKLGDSDKKISSKTSFNILQLETIHPLMKPIIISAIESNLLFRRGQSLHAKYYATITLNQTVLSGKEEEVARKLLDIYFSLFIMLFKSPDSSKVVATGANSTIINKKGEVQGGGGTAGKKAQRRMTEKEKATSVEDDLREKMLSAVFTGVNRAMPFTSTNDESFEKHLNTLFMVTHSSNFNTSIQVLMLIQQLTGLHQGAVDRFYRTLYESLLDPRLITSSKQALYLNLLFRALKSDLNVKRVQAFAKRLMQVVAMHQPSFACGTLYLLRELEVAFPSLSTFMDQAAEASDDEEENFRDVQEAHDLPRSSPLPSQHRSKTSYDGRKRDPSHAHASVSSLWELTPLVTHYHPSVSLFATRLLTHDTMPPKPDLSLNTLIHFLDRFVYRNPKTTSTARGASIMQGGDSSALLVSRYSERERSRVPVNSEAFWKMEGEKVGANEVFFHRYFSTLGRGNEKARKKKAERRKNLQGSDSEGDEEEIWKALVESRPEVEGASDRGVFSDGDINLEDLEDTEDVDAVEDDFGNQGVKEDVDNGSLDLGDEDDEALFDGDAEIPSDLEDAAQFEQEFQSNQRNAAERKSSIEDIKRNKKRRKLKSLPTFASAEDYSKMLGDEDEEGYD